MAVKDKPTRAIETYYKSTRFRSRLEAKWALFFDELGIIWDYECEGFESRGIRYLPDFYLPELGYFFEVKPYAPSAEEFYKSAIGVESSKKPLILSWGYPRIDHETDGSYFDMVHREDFLMREKDILPLDYLKFPSIEDRFGLVGIDDTAAETLLGCFNGIRLVQEQFFVGGLERAEIRRCSACKKCYFDAEFNAFIRIYDDSYICPFGCEKNIAYEFVAAAAIKARNHRFGRIA